MVTSATYWHHHENAIVQLVKGNGADSLSKDAHDDVIKWKHSPHYWPFVRGIHRSPVNSLHKCQWRGVLMFSLICTWINCWINNHEAGDLRRHRSHYDVIVMMYHLTSIGNVMVETSRSYDHFISIVECPIMASLHLYILDHGPDSINVLTNPKTMSV